MSPMHLAERLVQLSNQVARLTVSRRDPEQFFEQRSEIAAEIRRLALELRR